jgi:hypothetical protein
MTGRLRGLTGALATLALLAAGACSNDTPAQNRVFFVGYAYDGASGARLDKTKLSKVSIAYGEKTIAFDIADDGRFTSVDPLPTWQDYTVKIEADGYRSFASYNVGVDVPASLAMTNGVAQAATTQTLDFSASLFPVAVKAPKFSLTIQGVDSMTGMPVTDKIDGQIRLRPQAAPTILIGGSSATTPAKRLWTNGEDLLTQTIVKPFMNGSAVVDEGEMVYGVSYELTIYGVDGYQPCIFTGPPPSTATGMTNCGWTLANNGFSSTVIASNPTIVAGFVTSENFQLIVEAQDPLRIVNIDGATCAPPSPMSSVFGGKVTLTFNSDIEIVSSTLAEDIDNGISLSVPQPQPPQYSSYCTLRPASGDPAQERGSKVEVGTDTLTFSFNPTIGIATSSTSSCMLPPSITSITYYSGNPTISVQPKGQPTRKRTLSSLLTDKGLSQITCPLRSNF